MTGSLGLLACTMGLLMAAAPLLQLRRIRARGAGGDVSQAFLAVIVAGAGSYALYGLALADPFVWVPNTAGVLTNALTLLAARRHSAS